MIIGITEGWSQGGVGYRGGAGRQHCNPTLFPSRLANIVIRHFSRAGLNRIFGGAWTFRDWSVGGHEPPGRWDWGVEAP